MTQQDRIILHRYDAGDTLADIAKTYCVGLEHIRHLAKVTGHTKPRGWRRTQRREQIATLFRHGRSVDGISLTRKLSVVKVRQLLRETGDLPTETQRLFGLDDFQYRCLSRKLSADGHVQHAYTTQRRNALLHRQEWGFRLDTWWAVWKHSGHWEESISMTGSRRGYVMTRRNPRQPWSPSNALIVPWSKVLHRGSHLPRSPESVYLVDHESLIAFKSAVHDAITILHVFRQRRASAKLVHQPWSVSLINWWRIWERSGHWEQRGVHGFVMCRKNTRLGWISKNVQIVSVAAKRRHSG